MSKLVSRKNVLELQIRVLKTLREHGGDADDRFAAAEEILDLERRLLSVQQQIREEESR